MVLRQTCTLLALLFQGNQKIITVSANIYVTLLKSKVQVNILRLKKKNQHFKMRTKLSTCRLNKKQIFIK